MAKRQRRGACVDSGAILCGVSMYSTSAGAVHARLSGPLLDRIDLHVEVAAVKYRELGAAPSGDSSATVATRIAAARARQHTRLGEGRCNAEMHARELHACARPIPPAPRSSSARWRSSALARAYTRVLKVARTIADLAGAEQIGAAHVAEAIRYRALDRERRG